MTSTDPTARILINDISTELATFFSTQDTGALWRLMNDLSMLRSHTQGDSSAQEFLFRTLKALLDDHSTPTKLPVLVRAHLYYTQAFALEDLYPDSRTVEKLVAVETMLELYTEVKEALKADDRQLLGEYGAEGTHMPTYEALTEAILLGELLYSNLMAQVEGGEEYENLHVNPEDWVRVGDGEEHQDGGQEELEDDEAVEDDHGEEEEDEEEEREEENNGRDGDLEALPKIGKHDCWQDRMDQEGRKEVEGDDKNETDDGRIKRYGKEHSEPEQEAVEEQETGQEGTEQASGDEIVVASNP